MGVPLSSSPQCGAQDIVLLWTSKVEDQLVVVVVVVVVIVVLVVVVVVVVVVLILVLASSLCH